MRTPPTFPERLSEPEPLLANTNTFPGRVEPALIFSEAELVSKYENPQNVYDMAEKGRCK